MAPSEEPRPVYASEQDLPSEAHPPVQGYDENGNACPSCDSKSKIAFPTSDLESSVADVSSSSSSSSAAGDAQGNKKKAGKPLLDTLLKKNAQWSQDVSSVDRYFFKTSALQQAPKVLWLGCCDSRVPETTLVAARPGDIFVHRNIANQFHQNDDSAQAALAFAVQEAGVQHVLVVGHTVCGGCKAAYGSSPDDAENKSTALNRFLAPLISLRHSLQPLEGSTEVSMQDLVEENVRATVNTIASTEVVQKNWKLRGIDGVQIHGLVYHLETGRLHNLHISVHPPALDEEDEYELGIGGGRKPRSRHNSQAEREKADEAVLSKLLDDLRIPMKKSDDDVGPLGRDALALLDGGEGQKLDIV